MSNDSKKCSCPFREWEIIPWFAALFVALIVVSMLLGGGNG